MGYIGQFFGSFFGRRPRKPMANYPSPQPPRVTARARKGHIHPHRMPRKPAALLLEIMDRRRDKPVFHAPTLKRAIRGIAAPHN